MTTLSHLKGWREQKARMEGVELFRVLPNATIEEIARVMPKTKEALLSIKGIKEAKYRKYGAAILEIVAETASETPALLSLRGSGVTAAIQKEKKPDPAKGIGIRDDGEDFSHDLQSPIENLQSDTISVSQFLDGVNLELSGMAARVRGEVSSVDERERVVYFSIKDAEDGSTLSCLMFRSAYAMSGVRLSIGDEIIIEGAPEIWKPMGKLSMKCAMIEYAGEGVLKKAYDALFKKLSDEGLLASERKRPLPEFPERIALLTSRDGAAIGDFMMNVGRHGYKIDLFASSVEGARAVPELLSGLRSFKRHADLYDVLVIIRGGGSLESLAAFNNEVLVRAIADFPLPVVAGIGHEKDVTLATLVADAGVSTPTAASRLIRQSWEDGSEQVLRAERVLVDTVSDTIRSIEQTLAERESFLMRVFQDMKERIQVIVSRFFAKRETMRQVIRARSESVSFFVRGMKKISVNLLENCEKWLLQAEKSLVQFDPNRALSLGYSLVRIGNGKILRKSTDAHVGDRLEVRLSKGSIEAEVRKIFDK